MGENEPPFPTMRVLLVPVSVALCLAPISAWAQTSGVTYTRDVAPIIRERCAPCHQAGEAAPFSLVTFTDVRARARLIKQVTQRRYMPPWKPTRGVGGPFVGDQSLTDAEITTIAQWVDEGAPEGQPATYPITQLPNHPMTSQWRLGTPDLVVTLDEPYTLPADGPDLFRNFVLPIPVADINYVAGVEVRLNGASVVHHANLRFDQTLSSRELDLDDPLPGYEGPAGVNARYPDGYFLGWTPGQIPVRVPSGMAWRLMPNTDLVLQLHLRKSGKVEHVRPSVGFFFTKDAPVRLPLALRLGRQNIDIAPGHSYLARDSYQLPVDVELHAIHPHAHYRARDIKAFATLPDGTRRALLHIADWDFNWQDVYRFSTPPKLPRGTTIVMEFTYDNSAGNPRNPDSPPKRVIFGQNSSDEMGDLWLQVLPLTALDRARLYRDFYPKTVAEDAVGYEMLLTAEPNHAGYHSDLALLQARLGKREEAIAHLQAATRLKPDFVSARYNLATLHVLGGNLREAVVEFRAALAIRPNHAQTHNNLGVVLKAQGFLTDAVEHFRRAVALDPNNSEARANLCHMIEC